MQVDVNKTLSQYIRLQASKYPDELYCHNLQGENLSFSELNLLVDKCATYLSVQGIKAGDILVSRFTNSIEFIVIFFAIIRAGGIMNPAPSNLSDNELLRSAKFLGAKKIILDKPLKCNDDSFGYLIFQANSLEKFRATIADYVEYKLDLDEEAEYSCLFYTSGTTSSPKCIKHSSVVLAGTAKLFAERLGFFQRKTRHLAFLPSGHTSFIAHSLLPTLISSGSILVASSYLAIANRLWKILLNYKITYIQVVPTVAMAMLEADSQENYIVDPMELEIDFVACGSAPLSLSLQNNFKEKFHIPMLNFYGLSETGAIFFNDPNANHFNIESIGTPMNAVEWKLVGSEGGEVGPGVVGELMIKSPTLFLGYFKNQAETKNSFEGDFFKTGDLLRFDTYNNFYYVAREKDMIIRAGVNISPAEIEDLVMMVGGVLTAVVFGIPNKLFGEDIVCGYTTNYENGLEEEIRKFMSSNVGKIRQPTYYIKLDSVPMTASGKYLRRLVRDQYINDFGIDAGECVED